MSLFKCIKINTLQLKMFTDQNQLFLRNFESTQDPRDDNNQQQQMQCFTPCSAPPQFRQYFNGDSDGFFFGQNNAQQNKQYQVKKPINRMNTVINSYSRSRKFSQCKIQTKKNVRENDQVSLTAKSQANQSDQQSTKKVEQHVQKQVKSIGGKSECQRINEIQSAFMRKIRNLQARIKNVNLNYQTLVSKLKKDHNELQKVNKQIRLFLQIRYPQIHKQMESHIVNIQKSMKSSFGGTSSDSSIKNNEQWMPIFSKIQQLRFDGQKMCQNIKTYQQTLLKKQKLEEQMKKQIQKQSMSQGQKRKLLFRKFSIPAGLAYQRQQLNRKFVPVQIGQKMSQSNHSQNTRNVQISEGQKLQIQQPCCT